MEIRTARALACLMVAATGCRENPYNPYPNGTCEALSAWEGKCVEGVDCVLALCSDALGRCEDVPRILVPQAALDEIVNSCSAAGASDVDSGTCRDDGAWYYYCGPPFCC